MYFSHQSTVWFWAVFQFSLCRCACCSQPGRFNQTRHVQKITHPILSVFWCLKVLYDIHSMFEACCCFLLSLVCFSCVRMKRKRFSLSRFLVTHSCHGGLKLFFMLFKMFDHRIHTDILSYKSWWGFIAGTLNEMTRWRLNHLWGPQLNSFQVDIDASVAPLSNLRSIRCRCEAEWRLDDRASLDWLLGFMSIKV